MVWQPRPDIFRLIKRVTLLSKDGYAVYSGAMEPATEYFRNLGHISPSPSIHVVDYMLDVVIKGSNQVCPASAPSANGFRRFRRKHKVWCQVH